MTQTFKKAALYLAVLAVMLATVIFVLPVKAGAAYTGEYNINSASVTISSDGTYRIYGSGSVTTNTITVSAGVTAEITLDNVKINTVTESNSGGCAFKIGDNSTGNVTINLSGTNELKSGFLCAGLEKNGGTGTLTINGPGSLAVEGCTGAGIGSANNNNCTNVTINGGTISATGGGGGAGIGGGLGGQADNIVINGGTITAKGGVQGGAGIGGSGDLSDGGSGKNYGVTGKGININGGTVTALGTDGGAGIGGCAGLKAQSIYINGGSVKAVGSKSYKDSSKSAPAIGGGVTNTFDIDESTYDFVYTYYNGTPVTVKNSSNVYVYLAKIEGAAGKPVSLNDGAPITYSAHTNDSNLYFYLTNDGKHHLFVDGKLVVLKYQSGQFIDVAGKDFAISGTDLKYDTDYTYEDGILLVKSIKPITVENKDNSTATSDRITLNNGTAANITLNGVNICANYCAFDTGTGSAKVTVTIPDGTTNMLVSGSDYAGLQKSNTGGALEIKGGSAGTGILEATGGSNGGAGIGGGNAVKSASNITISNCRVTATGGTGASGIGGGNGGTSSNIIIKGGSVKGSIGCTPTNVSENVYLLKLNNSGRYSVKVNGKTYSPTYHSESDTNLYLYIPAKPHDITLGSTSSRYDFDGTKFVEIGTALNVTASNSGNTLIYGTDYSYPKSTGLLTILSNKAVTIANANSSATNKIKFVIDNSYTWIIDGSKITTPLAADLILTKTTSTKSGSLRGIMGTQFHINNTNVPTNLEISFKASHAGKFANLYKLVDGKPVFVTCAKLGVDGKVILPNVTEKGNYVVMLCEFSDRPGDMNNDGVLDAMDASAILKDIVGLEPGINSLTADFNGDGLINALDVAAILKRIVGLA